MKSVRGLTLVELLVAAALLGLLLTLFFWFLVPSLRLSGQQAARVDLQQQATMAVRRIVADLEQSSTEGVGILPFDPGKPSQAVALGIDRIEDVLPDGQQAWADSLVVYYWDRADAHLYRQEWPPQPPDLGLPFSPARPVKPTGDDLLEIVGSDNGTRRSLALGVTAFEIEHTGAEDNIGLPLTVRLVLERPVAQKSEPERFEIERVVTVRN